jgi:3D (Asp-Asp-Asp) domain-containing protein
MFRNAVCLLALVATVAPAQKPAAEKNAVEKTTEAAPVAPKAAAKTAAFVAPPTAVPTGPMPFIATAYSTKGNTVKGVETQPGIVAADKRILPLGSTIRVSDAGKYSGLYIVTDVGTAIIGNRIDIYILDIEDARAFGRKNVTVELIKPGDNVKFQPETTTEIPKSALAPKQKVDASAIPSNKVPADKPAVVEGRAVKAEQKVQEKKEEKIEEAKKQ